MFKMIYNIARTELQMLFYSPVAWLILVVFGVQSGMLFADQLAGLVSAQEMGYDIQGSTISIFANRWGGVFTTMQNYLYFYIPLLTMSLVSKELSSGSIRLLYSSPITNTQIIVGKYLLHDDLRGVIMMGILIAGGTLCGWSYRLRILNWPMVFNRVAGIVPADLCVRGDRYIHVQSDFLPDRGGDRYVCRVDGIEHDRRVVAGVRFYT